TSRPGRTGRTMKGSVLDCIEMLVSEKFGRPQWEEILSMAGQTRKGGFLPSEDIDDPTVFAVLEALCAKLGLTTEQALDAFGEYWMNIYAPRYYKAYFYGARSAREFLLRMDQVHERLTKNIPNARPPRFQYRWLDNRTLIMEYSSE